MSILGGFENFVSKGFHLAGEELDASEKLAKDSVDSLEKLGSKAAQDTVLLPELTISCAWNGTRTLANTVSELLPGIADKKHLVRTGDHTLKNTASGEIFKLLGSTSIRSLLGQRNNDSSSLNTLKPDTIFNYVSAAEWKQIINDTQTAKRDSSNGVPKAITDESGIEFSRASAPLDQASSDASAGISINGSEHIHKDKDGTLTIQDGSQTQIEHDGRKIFKNADNGVLGEQVDGRTAWEEDTKDGTQEWNTKQGLRIVEQAGQYKIYDQAGSLIATRPVSVVSSEVQEMDQTLVNGDQMHQHLVGSIVGDLRSLLPKSGAEWDVYADGIAKTLKSGVTIGMMNSGDAFAKVDQTVLYRKASTKQYYIVDENHTQELNLNKASRELNKIELAALNILRGLDSGNKLEMNDGTYLTVADGTVVGGEDAAIDEPAQSRTPDRKPRVTQVQVAMVTTGHGETTSVLKDGYQSHYNWRAHQSSFCDSGGKPIVQITDNQLTTADVISTKQGTRDRTTGDFMGADGSIVTSNGIHVSPNNDITFADGTAFNHDGSISLANGTTIRPNTSDESSQQATSTLSSAMSIADAIAAKASSGTITLADIAQLQASISQVNSLIGVCMQAGNLEATQALMQSETSLEAALDKAENSFTGNTMLRAMRATLQYGTSHGAIA